MWNTAMKLIVGSADNDFSLNIGSFKDSLRSYLLAIQNQFHDIEWYPGNFEFKKLDLP